MDLLVARDLLLGLALGTAIMLSVLGLKVTRR